MYRPDPDELRAAREQLVTYGARLLDDGLAVGSAGNLSMRVGDMVAITPSGIGYRELRPADICLLAPDGTEVDAPEVPSSETPMHLAIYAATPATAIVHTHSPEVIALSSACDELPAIHYAITGLGGPVRVARYVRFGSDDLAEAAVEAMAGRRAAILQNHGAISYGRSVAEAYDRAQLLEWLARIYRMARCYGTPRVLSAAELAEVTAEAQRRHYGDPGHRRQASAAERADQPDGAGRPDGRSPNDGPGRWPPPRSQRGVLIMAVLSLPAPFHGADQVLLYGFIVAALWYALGLYRRLRKGTAGVKPIDEYVD